MTRAIDVVKRLCPKARQAYLDAFETGDALLAQHGVDTPLRLAHFLAQVLHESGGLTVTFENMNYSAPRMIQIFGVGHHSAAVTVAEAQRLAGRPSDIAERVYGLGNPKKAHELGNTARGDGFKYRGGGILQTTGRGNYARMGAKCGADFEGQPDLVCTARYALMPALAEWTEGNCNALAEANDIRAITRKINGGYNGLAERQAWFAKVRPLLDKVEIVPKAAPSVPVVKPKASPDKKAAGTVAAAGTATIVAHQAGVPPGLAVGIGILVAIAALIFFILRKGK